MVPGRVVRIGNFPDYVQSKVLPNLTMLSKISKELLVRELSEFFKTIIGIFAIQVCTSSVLKCSYKRTGPIKVVLPALVKSGQRNGLPMT